MLYIDICNININTLIFFMASLTKDNIEKNTDDYTEDNDKPKYKWLKRIGIFFIVVYGLSYIFIETSRSRVNNESIKIFTATNQLLTNQNTTIEKIYTRTYGDGSIIYNFKMGNPTGFSAPYALLAPEATITSGFTGSKELPYIIIQTLVIKNAHINYEINNQQVNLYKILDNIIANVRPATDYIPLNILQSASTTVPELRYQGTKFFLGTVIFQNSTLTIYNNNTKIKSGALNNIYLTFKGVKQPLTYADALLAGGLQLIDVLDRTVKTSLTASNNAPTSVSMPNT